MCGDGQRLSGKARLGTRPPLVFGSSLPILGPLHDELDGQGGQMTGQNLHGWGRRLAHSLARPNAATFLPIPDEPLEFGTPIPKPAPIWRDMGLGLRAQSLYSGQWATTKGPMALMQDNGMNEWPIWASLTMTMDGRVKSGSEMPFLFLDLGAGSPFGSGLLTYMSENGPEKIPILHLVGRQGLRGALSKYLAVPGP